MKKLGTTNNTDITAYAVASLRMCYWHEDGKQCKLPPTQYEADTVTQIWIPLCAEHGDLWRQIALIEQNTRDNNLRKTA